MLQDGEFMNIFCVYQYEEIGAFTDGDNQHNIFNGFANPIYT